MRKLLLILGLLPFVSFAKTERVLKANAVQGLFSHENFIKNPGCDKNTENITASGGTLARDTTNNTSSPTYTRGSGGCSWDPSGNQTLTFAATKAMPGGARNGEARCYFKTDATNYKLQVYDGSSVLNQVDILPSTGFSAQSVPFTISDSGATYQLRLANATDDSIIYLDDCYLGDATGLTEVKQATFIGMAYYAATASCDWTLNSGGFVDFTAASACPAPTIATESADPVCSIQALDSNLPQVTLSSSCPAGRYVVTASGSVQSSDTSARYRVALSSDTQSVPAIINIDPTGTSGDLVPFSLTAGFESTGGARVFKLQGNTNGTDTMTIVNSSSNRTAFTVTYYPPANNIAIRNDQVSRSWTGHFGTDCAWTRSSSTPGLPSADATCTFVEDHNDNFGTVTVLGSKQPGFNFTPKSTGTYEVCYFPALYHSGTAGYAESQLYDGTNIIARAVVRSVSSGNNQIISTGACGHVTFTAGTTSTVEVLLASSDNTNNANMATSNDGITSPLQFTIKNLSAGFPAPSILGSVYASDGVSQYAVEPIDETKATLSGATYDSSATKVNSVTALRLNGTKIGKTYTLSAVFVWTAATSTNSGYSTVTIPLSNFSFLSGKTLSMAGGTFMTNVNSSAGANVVGSFDLNSGDLRLSFSGVFNTTSSRSGTGSLVIVEQ